MDCELNSLVIGYPGHVVAGPMDAVLRSGELCYLLGANGAGKSTLLRTLSAFQRPLSGEVRIDNELLSSLSPQMLSTRLGIVLTERVRPTGMTVRDMAGMGRSPYTNFWGRQSAEDRQKVDEALRLVGIEELAERQVTTLSDGERQKVMIAKVLAQETPIILLDEPTAFLDFPSKVETMLLLRRLAREMNKTILLSTHDLDLALQTADRLWLMAKAQPLRTGTPKALAEEGILSAYFPGRHIRFDAEALRFAIRLTGETDGSTSILKVGNKW